MSRPEAGVRPARMGVSGGPRTTAAAPGRGTAAAPGGGGAAWHPALAGPPIPQADPGRTTPVPLGIASAVVLTKSEVFGACQALADADRALLRTGRVAEAGALGDLFDLLEQRLAVPVPAPRSAADRRLGVSPRPAGTRSTGS